MEGLIEGRAVDVALPYRLERLTYRYSGPLVPGARVLVPLKGKKKIALLLGEAKNPPSELKEAYALLDKAPVVPQRLLDFLLWVADFHLAPEEEVLKYALPPSLFRLPRKKPPTSFEGPLREGQPGLFESSLFFSEDLEERAECLGREIEKTLSEKKSVLFLVPDRELLSFYAERLKKYAPVVYTGDLTPKRRETVWFSALKGEISLVVGTRLALFLPLSALGLIVVEEEEHRGYKQEEGFRGHFKDLALVRAQKEGAKLLLASASPSVRSYFWAEKGKYQLRLGKREKTSFSLVNLRGNQGYLSRTLLNHLRRVRAHGKQALLFLNRLGYAPVLVCEECGYLWVCPRCQIPLRWFKNESKLRCRICPYETKAAPLCPSCGGGAPKPLGAGTERLAEILSKFFPEACIKLYDHSGWEEADFVIATAKLPRFTTLSRLSLVAVVFADQLFGHASYLAAERAYQLLKRLSLLSQRHGAKFLVQTLRPNHHVLKGLRAGYEAFYREELFFRHQQKYPPFGRIAEVILKPNPKIVNEVEELVEKFLKEQEIDSVGPLMESPRGKVELFYLLRASRVEPLKNSLKILKERLQKSFGSRIRIVVDMSPE